MRHIGAQLKKSLAKTKDTERGELLLYFAGRINPERIRDGYPKITLGRLGKVLQGVPTKDLYYLKRVCDDAQNFSKKFWFETNPKKHTPEAKAQQEKLFKQRELEERRNRRQ